jgi:hypothetical protein
MHFHLPFGGQFLPSNFLVLLLLDSRCDEKTGVWWLRAVAVSRCLAAAGVLLDVSVLG